MIFKRCVSGTRIQNVIVIWDHRRMIWRQASLKMTFHKCLVKMHIELQRRSNHDEERRTDWHSILWWPLALRAIKKIKNKRFFFFNFQRHCRSRLNKWRWVISLLQNYGWLRLTLWRLDSFGKEMNRNSKLWHIFCCQKKNRQIEGRTALLG